MNIPVGLKNFVTYKGSLSRVGFVLLGIGIFLLLVSYAKGIQILIFIPALVLALFLFSFFEISKIRKHLRVYSSKKDKNGFIRIHADSVRHFSFRLGIATQKGITMLQPEENGIKFVIPKGTSGELVIFFTGLFDILRYVMPLTNMSLAEDGGEQQQADAESEHFFVHVKSYEPGDRTNRMDSLKSAIKNTPFIKNLEYYRASDTSQIINTSRQNITIESSLILERKNDLKRADMIHFLLILLNFTVILVHWGNLVLSGMLFLAIVVVGILRKTTKIQKNRIAWYRNATMIALFCIMLGFTWIEGNMGLPGSVFLTQILIVKKLFPDNKEDGFLYIFLSLFVFVAVAITSTALWFILFFLAYLILAVLLLSTVTGYGFAEPVNASISTRIQASSYFVTLLIVLAMTSGLFFLLPHGEAIEQNTNFIGTPPQETLSGFSNEINLKNITEIKKDPSKKIVIENIDKNQADELRTYYWKGDRYTQFLGNKWEKPGYEQKKNISIPPSGFLEIGKVDLNSEKSDYHPPSPTHNSSYALEKYRITYHTIGVGNLFFPKTPEAINFSNFHENLSLQQGQKDSSLISITPKLTTPLTVDVFLKRSTGRNVFVDSTEAFVPFKIRIPPETEQLFKKFWDGIDPKLQKNPAALARYIRNQAGFKYSIEAPAENLESFLYGTRQGHCEYFATVLTLTLQHFGYQATIVNGFYGGEWNGLAAAMILQGQDAHAWTEVYDQSKREWTVLDATPIPPQDGGVLNFKDMEISLAKIYDYLDIRWYTYIANFSRSDQKALFLGIWQEKNYLFAGIGLIFVVRWLTIGYRRMREHIGSDYETRLVRYLESKKKIKFLLRNYENTHPELVESTRKLLYGKIKMTRSQYLKTLKEWKSVIKT